LCISAEIKLLSEASLTASKKLFENSKIIGFVIEDDQHYSPARIAGFAFDKYPDAESVEQTIGCCSPSASVEMFCVNPAILAGL